MARFEDALTGWEIFLGRSGEVSKNQLNAALSSRGREPISDRTYKHYSKLLRLGYSDYVSINRLDIRHANESIFDDGDRARYSDRETSSPGRLLLPRARDVLTLHGRIGRVSEGYATLRVQRSDDALEAARATKYDKGVLSFDEVGVERAVQVTEALDRGPQIDLVLAFRSLLETDLIPSAVPSRSHLDPSRHQPRARRFARSSPGCHPGHVRPVRECQRPSRHLDDDRHGRSGAANPDATSPTP